ncbi:MAG: hypothetical protein QXL96_02760 [Ignisphaera sp.]
MGNREVIHKCRKRVVKWILVASFGYLCYRNSLFDSVMVHELVIGINREILGRARITIEKEGYRVVHVIVDSISIENVRFLNGCEELKISWRKLQVLRLRLELVIYGYIYLNISPAKEEPLVNTTIFFSIA